VADKRCENGHFIDESWDICPYCPQDNSDTDIPVVRPTRSQEPVPPPAPAPLRAVPAPPPESPRHTNASIAPPSPRREVASSGPSPAASGGQAPAAAAMQLPPMERTIAAARFDPQAQPKRYVVGWLVGLVGSSRGESFPVRIGRNVLGRDRRSDVVINDDQASSHHADLVFRPEERRFILMDHNSTNGTYVNEMEIEPRRDLMAKDIIRVGSNRFLFMPLCHDGFYWDDEGALK
jgi:hypothetical protein